MVSTNNGNTYTGKVHEIWEVLEQFGWYQIVQYTCICLPTVFATMAHLNYVFVLGNVGYRCRTSECDTNQTLDEGWWNITTTNCMTPVALNNCSADITKLQTCEEFEYENENSAVSALNLGCSPWRINSVGTVHNLGMLVAMLVTGLITDKFGRKFMVIFTMVSGCVGLLKALAPSYLIYIVIEFVEAAITGGGYSVTTVLMIEITGRKKRVLSGLLFSYAIYLGETLFASIAMVVPYWKHLILIVYSPPILSLLLIFLLNESPRWQVVNGKTEDAINNLKKIAKFNNMKLNTQGLSNLDANGLREKFNIGNYEKREGLKEVLQSKEMMKRLTVCAFARFTSNFVYYGLVLNSVWLPGNKYVNFLLATVMSFPGELLSLFLMNKIGRKLPLLVGFICSGILCLVSAFVPDTTAWPKLGLYFLSKVIVALCFTGVITYGLELFPTSARGSLLGLCAFAARMGGMLAPLTPLLKGVSEILPAACFAITSVITGLLFIITPETKRLPLMDTIEQVENSIRRSTREVAAADNPVYTGESEITKI